jgi:predicted O-methyltransferase YrrM
MAPSTSVVFFILGICASLSTLALDLRRRRILVGGIFRQPVFASLDLLPPALTAGLTMWMAAYSLRSALLPVRSPAPLIVIVGLVALPVFWAEGRRQIQFQRPIGLLFAEWLVAAGSCWIALATFFPGQGIPSAAFAIFLLVAGGAVIIAVVPPFVKKYEGLRILERVADNEQFSQPEYTPATPECPQPELWRMLDSQTTEVEVLEFLKTLVTTLKPRVVLETGTFLGHGTMKLAEGVRENGFGKVITVEADPAIRAKAEERFQNSGLAPWIESRLESSLDTQLDENIDLFYSDSRLANREAEIRRLLPRLDPRGVLVIHDASSHFKIVREAALRLEQEGLISAVLLSTPRGVVIAQRREGRQ